MKKNVLLSIAFLMAMTINLTAQSSFKLKETSFVGAIGAEAGGDWTKGWTNFDPKNATYGAATDTTTLNGMVKGLPLVGEKEITGTLTLDATKVYLLKGLVIVRSGGKLVIPAGTVIRAIADLTSSPKNYASIIVERGGKIEVNGTETSPVVITSNKAVGQRERGDWGGLVLAGKAFHNLLDGTANNNVQMEGFNNVTFDSGLAKFGGTDPTDNSGIVKYLRLEFGGLAFELNKEINGLTLGAVGSATELHHIQVSFSNDDSFEWFGGSVNSSNLIAWKGTDDDFDTDNGYSGLSQFGIAVRDSSYFDGTYALTTGASTSEGFESDNEGTGTANVRPYTNCVFSNFTMVGPVPVGKKYSELSGTAKAAFRRGARLRRNSSQRVVNSIFMGYRNFLMIDGDSTLRNTNFAAALALVKPNTAVDVKTKQVAFANNIICNTTTAYTSTTDTTANGLVEVARAAGSAKKLAALDAYVRTTGKLANNINPVTYTAGTLLVNPVAASATPNFAPVANSPALTGANFKDNPVLANLYITGAKELEAAQIAPIYPNPISNGTLNFGREVVSFGIFDITGKLIQYGFDTNQTTIENLSKGTYFIKLDGNVQKLIVQ
jgi:hypothetical protein